MGNDIEQLEKELKTLKRNLKTIEFGLNGEHCPVCGCYGLWHENGGIHNDDCWLNKAIEDVRNG